MSTSKSSILSLPLSPSLPESLTPDPAVPSVSSLLSLSSYEEGSDPRPTILRRSRQVKGAHFSYVTPLPLSFPYAVNPEHIQPKPRKVDGEAVGDGSTVKEGKADEASKQADEPQRSISIEDYLASLEPDLQDAVGSDGSTRAYTSEIRKQVVGTPHLFGLSQKALQDVLPNLDVGDSFESLETGKDGQGSEKRRELASVLAGHLVVARPQGTNGSDDKGFAPWSLCYGGHQFGSWASQLGDGRAISILTTPSSWPNYLETPTYYPPVAELQLKGAGRTPYSRFADGLAVLRSSVREYLGSEAMAALRIPTSRALSLIHLPDVQVARERMETAAVVCRIAPSWLRIGNFELQWSRDDWDALADLVNYAGSQVFGFDKPDAKLEDEPEDGSNAAKVLRETSRRTARMIAGWQTVGFMHGVMNTDNISISGLTIDYGPYAFMDVYNQNHICNHSDGEGRYSYRNQPPIGIDAVYKFGSSLAEIIGCELEMAESSPSNEGAAQRVSRGWAKDSEKLEGWRETGLKVVEEIATEFTAIFMQEYRRLMGLKLGLSGSQENDYREHFDPLLSLMAAHKLDFSRTFRTLCQFESTSSKSFEKFLDLLVPDESVPAHLKDSARQDWKDWLKTYEARLASADGGALSAEKRREGMRAHNPRFILRQWVLEEAIKRLEEKDDVHFLQKVLHMATNPFESYGEDVVGESAAECRKLSEEEQEERRLCGMGDEHMLGFQCSCSS